MIIRSYTCRFLPSNLQPVCFKFQTQQPLRRLHAHVYTSQSLIPPPTPFVPDPSTFLKLIGRNLSQHAAKITTWQALFSLTSAQLRELGVEPARSRRYLLWWRDRFRKGIFGVGGDLTNVKDGGAELRVVEVPLQETTSEGAASTGSASGIRRVKKMIVNEPAELIQQPLSMDKLRPIEGMKVVGVRTIVGPYVQPVKGTHGSVAVIKIQEGMWEVRRGVKVDGGERRKVQVRRQRLLQERKTRRT